MVIETNKNDVQIVGEVKENEVRIDEGNLEHILTLLSSNLYSNPVESFIREIVSNGIDATIEAGSNEPVIVKFAYDENSYMYTVTIRDYGTGISPERFQEVYLSIGASTKRLSNKYIGAFGLGKYSCLACANSALIKSFYEGMEYDYLMIKNVNKINIDLLLKRPTTEKNGVEITIQQERLGDYNNAIRKLIYFPNVYVDQLDSTVPYNDSLREAIYWLHNRKVVKKNNFYLGFTDKLRSEGFKTYSFNTYLVLGNVIYPFDYKYILDSITFPVASNRFSSYDVEELLRTINLRFDIGELDITPNREQLLYSDKTKKALVQRFYEALDELKELLKLSDNKDYDDLIEYYKKVQNLTYFNVEWYDVPKIVLCDKNQTDLTFKGKKRNEYYVQELKQVMSSIWPYTLFNIVKDGKFYAEGREKKNSYIKPVDIYINNVIGNPKLYLCTQEDLKSNYFKGYLVTLPSGIVITSNSPYQFLTSRRNTYKSGVLKDVYRYIRDNAVRITKDDAFNDYVKAKKAYTKATNAVLKKTNIRITIAQYNYYSDNFNTKNETYPLDYLFKIKSYNVRNRSNKKGIVLYCCLEDDCYKVLPVLHHTILGKGIQVIGIPKAHYKFVEANKPDNWVHLSKIINPYNKKIVQAFTYIKYGHNENIIGFGKLTIDLFLNYINKRDQQILKDFYDRKMVCYGFDVKNDAILNKWYTDFLSKGNDDLTIVEQINVVSKYIKVVKKLKSLRNLFSDGSIMIAYVAMKNGLLRLNYDSYKKVKDNLKIDKDEDNQK